MNSKIKSFYFDYAAATPMDQRVLGAMDNYWYKIYGNASSLHNQGRLSRQALGESRTRVADILGISDREVFFTSGGTESDNWAILGTARARENEGKHIIVSKIEHKAVLFSAKYLEKQGWQVDYCPVKENGLVDLEKLKDMVRDDTVLVSIMYANNEVGTIQNIRGISREIKKINPNLYFHTDACQAMNYLDVDIANLGVDLFSFSGSKMYGPKGIGVLAVKKGIKIEPLIMGGGQEKGLRSGTENVAGSVGLAEALDIARKISTAESRRLLEMREKIISRITKEIPETKLNGDQKLRLVNNVNFSFSGVEGESLVLYLDDQGIMASTGSACGASDLEPSHVLLALGQSKELAHGSLRITLGRWTSDEAVEYLLEILPKIVEKIRKMSATY